MEHRLHSFLSSIINDFPDPATTIKLLNLPGHGYMLGIGDTVPTDADTGWGNSAIFIQADASTLDTILYLNVGDTDSCNFDAIIGSGTPSALAVDTAQLAADAVTGAKVADSSSAGGLFAKKVAVATYDFSVDGGTEGAITLASTATIPDNAIVTAFHYDVITTCTSATDAATIAVSLPTDGALSTAIAISDAGNPWDAGAHLASEITPLAVKTTAARAVQITTAGGEDLTAGKIVFAVEYFVTE